MNDKKYIFLSEEFLDAMCERWFERTNRYEELREDENCSGV